MENVNFNNERVAALCNRYHPKTLRVFGSVARNEATSESDIDLLVTFSKTVATCLLGAGAVICSGQKSRPSNN
jgi:predicted nucleotidyltransferase